MRAEQLFVDKTKIYVCVCGNTRTRRRIEKGETENFCPVCGSTDIRTVDRE